MSELCAPTFIPWLSQLVGDDVLGRVEVMGKRRQSSLHIPLLDCVDEPLMLREDPEQVTWIAPRPHLHQADEPAQLVQELGHELEA